MIGELINRLLARFSGPMRLRFVLQPAMAVFLGVRDGRRDARDGVPPFLYNMLFKPGERTAHLASAARGLAIPVAIGVVADAIAQFVLFGSVNGSAAFLWGVGILAIPYAIARELTNRLLR